MQPVQKPKTCADMTTLHLDLETYCEVPITHGTHRYASEAEILLFAYAIDGGPVNVVDEANGQPRPRELVDALTDPSVLVQAHNSHFDRTVLRHTGTDIALPRWRDTMVRALAHGLPGSLGELCGLLGVDADMAKDKEGKQLVLKFCKPQPVNQKIKRCTKDTHPDLWEKFTDYAAHDILAMRQLDLKLPTWNYRGEELALWHLDQTVNDRGVLIDMDLVMAAIKAVAKAQADLSSRTQLLTDYALRSTVQRDALIDHITEVYGLTLPDLQGPTVEKLLKSTDIDAALRELLLIRVQASTTSVSKYRRLSTSTSDDGRLRGCLQFCGASRTGRWAGRLFQPQNLPRPTISATEVEGAIEAIKGGYADLLYDNVMQITSNALRGCLIAAPGHKLVVSDLSNIEGRDQAWLAGEQWKLDAFRAFDAGTGFDLYKLAYAKSFGVRPQDVTKDQRQIGKVQELALGYQGGVGAFLTFALAYGIDLEELAGQAIESIPTDILYEARDALAWTRKKKRTTFGLSDQAWLVCESFKRSWRAAHPHISMLWKDLEESAKSAIRAPGVLFECGLLKLQRDGAWLRIRLPSGRYVCYPSPTLDDDNRITYKGVNQYSRKWGRLNTYGGKIFENVCQAVARDVMATNMPRIEAAGYRIVLTVHDEVITEAPDREEFNDTHLSSLLATAPVWASDMPLAAGGFEGYRYRKD